MTSLCCPVDPHEMPKPMRRGMENIVERVVMRAVIDGDGQDLLLRVYMAGVYHGAEFAALRALAMQEQADG